MDKYDYLETFWGGSTVHIGALWCRW